MLSFKPECKFSSCFLCFTSLIVIFFLVRESLYNMKYFNFLNSEPSRLSVIILKCLNSGVDRVKNGDMFLMFWGINMSQQMIY